MKTLYVLRHGQAAPEQDADTDHERELTVRGRGEVRRAAATVLERGKVPSLVLTSSATRARQTAELCLEAWCSPRPPELRVLDELYLASPAPYLAALAAGADPHESVMVVGHNPGLETLVAVLSSRSEHLPTAALVEIGLPLTTWADLSTAERGFGEFVRVFRG